ncbi:GNAT family N-acetyltransferase [Candidatus Dojkabacteria bacterium]|nr:GNAT family N-acetyltransferase [Candidatus Dojkabacteria bacterium]
MKIIEVTSENVDKKGFFCKMSDRKCPGYQQKLKWLQERFKEGMCIKMLDLEEGGRGYIEYIPGKYAWRPIKAKEYMAIHCLWVVGKSKGNGYARQLLRECEKDAQKQGLAGVVAVTSEKPWLAEKAFFEKHGYEVVDKAPPSFSLMVKKFDKSAAEPKFSGDWETKQRKHPDGITVFRSSQCPYIDDAVIHVRESAEKLGLLFKVVELESAKDIRDKSPSAYGTFGIVYKGKLLSYYYVLPKDFSKLIKEMEDN